MACSHLDTQWKGVSMVKWRNKRLDELSKSELQYALQDAVEALTINQKQMDEKILFRGLLYGLFAGAFAAAATIGLITLM
ncbi:MAG: hypothetical protein ABJH63_02470 [Rhizobiaceae bacterium]